MDEIFLLANEASWIIEHIVAAVHTATRRDDPFPHLRVANVFPADIYAAMLQAMPMAADYRPMSGRTKYTRTQGGGTRTKIDLFPEFIRHLPDAKKPVWRAVGRALCSAEVREAFRAALAPGLEKRFGARHRSIGLYPIPALTRDVPGYRIGIHPDTRSKAVTIQLYLPADRSIEHVGTVFHKRTSEAVYKRSLQMPFAPNTGYAFAVADDTYHSVDTVGPEVHTRDSILLTYFRDDSALHLMRNRVKRLANFVRNEFRSLARSPRWTGTT
jgi:ribosomal protein L34E